MKVCMRCWGRLHLFVSHLKRFYLFIFVFLYVAAIRSTPQVEKPKPRPRKRKQCFDEAPVLTNKYGWLYDQVTIMIIAQWLLIRSHDICRFMKKALEDPSDLKRKKRKIPYSTLGIWKLEKNLRKEKVFSEPLITGELFLHYLFPLLLFFRYIPLIK